MLMYWEGKTKMIPVSLPLFSIFVCMERRRSGESVRYSLHFRLAAISTRVPARGALWKRRLFLLVV